MSKTNTETVKVMVRVRPMNKKEVAAGYTSVINVHNNIKQIELINPENNATKDFAFDAVYDTDS